jgi:four helix bundle protein
MPAPVVVRGSAPAPTSVAKPEVPAATAAGAISPDPAAADGVGALLPSDEVLDAVQLDASKLRVYGVALELHALCATLVAPLTRIVRDQLERASLSVVLNVAEAAGRHSRRDKARFYAIARGSATEVAALLDVLQLRRLAPPAAIGTGRKLAIRVVQMLKRDRDKALGVEGAGLEECNLGFHLEPRSAKTRRMRHERDQRTLGIGRRNAEHEPRPHLRDHTQVHDPNLAPAGWPQRPSFSRRSKA